MNELTNFDVLLIKTKNVSLLWDNSHGFAPENAARKLDKAMLDWQYELTKTLKIWMDKGTDMTIGELILARANLGAIVESWLRFFIAYIMMTILIILKKIKMERFLNLKKI